MAVILGEEIADSWASYNSSCSSYVKKWWSCPRCRREFVFRFNGEPPWPPMDLPCPGCEQTSPIPWPSSPQMVNWRCERCGTLQMVSRTCWDSRDKEYVEIHFGQFSEKCPALLRCVACGNFADSGAISDAIDGFFGFILHIFGADETVSWEYQRQYYEKAQQAFDRFLKKVSRIRAEQERLAEEERQRIKLEAKKRQEELILLEKQARTIAGLKKMKPTNFELAVASLYLKLGYEVYVTPASRDQGIDLIIIKDNERIAVQCKRYKHPVPVGQVRDFYGSFVGNYHRGVFVTSSEFSRATCDWAKERQGFELVNGQKLAELFVEHDPKIVRNFEKWEVYPPGNNYQ